MKKFKFRLEPLLKVKEHLEKECQKDHAVALQKVLSQQEYLQQIEDKRLSITDRQREEQNVATSVSPLQLLSYSRYYLKLKRDQIAGVELLRGLEKEAEKKRERLVEASRQRKTYDKLKERRIAKFNQTVEMFLNKEHDEIASSNFQFRKSH